MLAGEDTQFLCQSTQDATISWWGYIDGSHSGEARMVVIHKTDGFSRFGIGWGNSGTKFYVSYNQDDGHDRLQSSSNFAVGNWYNTVATKQGATIKLFIKYRDNPCKNIYTIRYEDLFENDYQQLRNLLDNFHLNSSSLMRRCKNIFSSLFRI